MIVGLAGMESASASASEQKPVVAFLGPPSSYTHQATKSAFPEQDYDYVPVATIKDVFDAVQAGDAPYGVVPFENSTHGVVTFTLDSLADRHDAYGDLTVCGEVYLDVHHFLLGYQQQALVPPPSSASSSLPPQHAALASSHTFGQHLASSSSSSSPSLSPSPSQLQAQSPGTSTPTQRNPNPLRPRASPLAPLDHVRRVLSHPQAFGQSNAFLATYLRGVDTVDVSSTSKAAETASRDASGATAAIAGEMAADMFGLDVLARCIEDRDDNTTRFFVLRRSQGSPGHGGHQQQQQEEEEEKGEGEGEGEGETRAASGGSSSSSKGYKSLVSFTVPHRSPGALAGVLDVFSTYGLNLTSINSLPSLIQPFQYLFFVEFEGSRHRDPEGKVKGALEQIDQAAQGWRWLGSWESQR